MRIQSFPAVEVREGGRPDGGGVLGGTGTPFRGLFFCLLIKNNNAKQNKTTKQKKNNLWEAGAGRGEEAGGARGEMTYSSRLLSRTPALARSCASSDKKTNFFSFFCLFSFSLKLFCSLLLLFSLFLLFSFLSFFFFFLSVLSSHRRRDGDSFSFGAARRQLRRASLRLASHRPAALLHFCRLTQTNNISKHKREKKESNRARNKKHETNTKHNPKQKEKTAASDLSVGHGGARERNGRRALLRLILRAKRTVPRHLQQQTRTHQTQHILQDRHSHLWRVARS
jgi:hypothetical protein